MAVKIIPALLAATILPLLAEYSGIWRAWFSHPWWSLQSTLIGIAIGVVAVIAVFLSGHRAFTLGIIALVLVLVFAGLTLWGKAGFAASFAEDRFAGKVWFYGFNSLNAALSSAAGLLTLSIFRRR